MKWALSGLAALAFCVGVGFLLFKNRPQGIAPHKIMNPTYFEEGSGIGRVVARRFYTELKKSKLIILGSSPFISEYDVIWKNLITAAIADGLEFGSFFTIEGLRPITKSDQIIKDLPKIELGPGITVVQVPSDELWKNKVMKAYGQADYIFFQYPFSMLEEGRKRLNIQCTGQGDSSFSCLAYKASTAYYRKELNENRLTAMMEQTGPNFYLLFIGEPF